MGGMNSPLAHMPIDQIKETDLQALVDNKVIERKTLEYKGALPGPKDADHKEFLSDVSSFANAVGGHLILGIGQDKKSGAPVGPVGLPVGNPDAEVQRLEQMILSGISPRIPNVDVRPISVSSGVAIVIRIARSWFRTHRVTYKGHDKFYSRTATGKYPMDVHEIRSAILMSETAAERIRSFRVERTGLIVAGDTPVPLEEGAKVVLHIVPSGGFEPGIAFDVTQLRPQKMGLLLPLRNGSDGERFNLDGLLTWRKRREATASNAYVQVFRNGSLEVVDGFIMPEDPRVTLIGGFHLEKAILEALPRYFDVLRSLGVEPPVFVMITMLGVAGLRMVTKDNIVTWAHPIDRDALFIPEILVENFAVKPAHAMKPAFDMIWNASGYEASPHYDDKGEWASG